MLTFWDHVANALIVTAALGTFLGIPILIALLHGSRINYLRIRNWGSSITHDESIAGSHLTYCILCSLPVKYWRKLPHFDHIQNEPIFAGEDQRLLCRILVLLWKSDQPPGAHKNPSFRNAYLRHLANDLGYPMKLGANLRADMVRVFVVMAYKPTHIRTKTLLRWPDEPEE